MNYDLTNIPAGYDRGRDHGPEMLALWMNLIGSHVQARTVDTILDLGCGTGRFSEALATHFNARVIGLDPSTKMLELARKKQRLADVQYQHGAAEAIPVAAGSVDMIFMSMSFHHFADPSLAARECRRVLRDEGTVFVRTGTFEQIQAYAYVPFLPSTRPMLEELLPDVAILRGVFESAGFHLITSEIVTQTVAANWTDYIAKLSAGGDSVLARLSAEELDAGLLAMTRHAADENAQAIVEPIDLFVFRPRS